LSNGARVDEVLDSVADTAEQVASDQRQVAREVRAMREQRRKGFSWASLLDRQQAPGLLGRIRRSRQALTDASGRLSRAAAAGMSAEGESHRAIARRLGVSHQRVTAILNGRRGDSTPTH
jgi:transcriptional regulator with XRE-family HTH domain